MSDAEQIAVVISAMMNTSGGVLEVQIDTGNLGTGSCCETKLKDFGSQLRRIITTQENWIPEHLFSRCVTQCMQEKCSQIDFFL